MLAREAQKVGQRLTGVWKNGEKSETFFGGEFLSLGPGGWVFFWHGIMDALIFFAWIFSKGVDSYYLI